MGRPRDLTLAVRIGEAPAVPGRAAVRGACTAGRRHQSSRPSPPGGQALRLPAVVALSVLLLAGAARANVFGEDRREQRDASLPPYRSVGVLRVPGSGAGTAFLVGRCHVLTAYHVAFMRKREPGSDEVETLPGRVGHAVEFLAGPDRALPGRFAAKTRATVVRFGPFAKGSFRGAAGDWAILRLARCLGDEYGYLAVARPARDAPMPAGELMTIGFPRSRAGRAGVAVERGCRARDHGPVPGLVGVDCAFERGMSGGPVLERGPDRRWRVAGVIQQATGSSEAVLPEYTMERRNHMVYAPAFAKALDGVLAAERAAARAPPPPAGGPRAEVGPRATR